MVEACQIVLVLEFSIALLGMAQVDGPSSRSSRCISGYLQSGSAAQISNMESWKGDVYLFIEPFMAHLVGLINWVFAEAPTQTLWLLLLN